MYKQHIFHYESVKHIKFQSKIIYFAQLKVRGNCVITNYLVIDLQILKNISIFFNPSSASSKENILDFYDLSRLTLFCYIQYSVAL